LSEDVDESEDSPEFSIHESIISTLVTNEQLKEEQSSYSYEKMLHNQS
jgi:hypothetical protein